MKSLHKVELWVHSSHPHRAPIGLGLCSDTALNQSPSTNHNNCNLKKIYYHQQQSGRDRDRRCDNSLAVVVVVTFAKQKAKRSGAPAEDNAKRAANEERLDSTRLLHGEASEFMTRSWPLLFQSL